MKKLGIEYVTAENGLLAVREYKSARQKFNVVLMGMSIFSLVTYHLIK